MYDKKYIDKINQNVINSTCIDSIFYSAYYSNKYKTSYQGVYIKKSCRQDFSIFIMKYFYSIVLFIFSPLFIFSQNTVLTDFSNWLTKSENLVSYEDFQSVLNKDTVDMEFANSDIFLPENIESTKEYNSYCAYVTLDNSDKSIAMLQMNDENGEPDFYLFTFDERMQKYRLFYTAKKNLYPFDYNDKTYFLEVSTKLGKTESFTTFNIVMDILETEKSNCSIEVSRVYKLSDEAKKYIDASILNKIISQDYSFLKDRIIKDSDFIEMKTEKWDIKGQVKSVAETHANTSMNLVLSVNGNVFDLGFAYGYDVTVRDGKEYLSIIKGNSESDFAYMNDIQLEVIDLDDGNMIYQAAISPSIDCQVISSR